jgi:DNA-directed DNA polymerase III PolC
MDNFVHLEVASAFSFLWGTFTPEALVARVRGLGQTAVALTDDNLFGAARFVRAARDAGIHPILGARLLLAGGTPVTLLVKSGQGFRNLCRLLSTNLSAGLRQRANLRLSDLAPHAEGLICLAGTLGEPLESWVRNENTGSAGQWLLELKNIFPGPLDLFVPIRNLERPGDLEIALQINKLSQGLEIPIVAVNSVSFLDTDDHILHQTLVDIQVRHHHRQISPLPNSACSLISGPEMARRLPMPEALTATKLIADQCRQYSYSLERRPAPRFYPAGLAEQNLTRCCCRELALRHKPIDPIYVSRLKQELSVIKQRGLCDFFWLVREVGEFARAKKIRHSVRGSAAGSLVVHLTLGGVDPIEHDLLFERFINDGRTDLPDADLDFDSQRRDEVIHYLLDRFPGRTALVSTIHTFKIRNAVRLCARALEYDLYDIERLTQCLPWSLNGLSLSTGLGCLPELAQSPLRNETRLVELADRLYKLPFQSSVHLGGVIITPGDIADQMPVGLSPKGFPVAQMDKDDLDGLGILKLDILGLRMHTAIGKSLEQLAAENIALDMDRLPLDDPDTYRLLSDTRTVGVFQVESPGQRQLLGRLQPKTFSDLIAEISLFRPGPVEGNMVDPFVRRRDNLEPVTYLHPDLEPILNETYGVVLFQEQVLRIVCRFAGLSHAQADAFRRAMTKSRPKGWEQDLKETFVKASLANGRSRELAEAVFNQVLALAAYGFCKAHAASFAHITYQSAYLKAHYPRSFYLGLLNAGRVGSYPPSVLLNEARRIGIPILGPHVNQSGLAYVAEGRGIRVPLWVVRGVGPNLTKRIVDERKTHGAFIDDSDFYARISLPPRLLANLTLARALDGLTMETLPKHEKADCA